MSFKGLEAGLSNKNIAKDLMLLDAHEEKTWSRSILGVDRAELIRILELGIRACPAAFAISRIQRAMES